ncbi:MAG: TonB-dependent receptor plug domain-containing protein, partial [Ignavibacteriaceae bacterium]|nr:TonB-dependent receptor plug domain-containing protein [Ignavibacteriaceae bacterium]
MRSFNLNFIKDFGFIGYPNETFIYGVGNSGISYLQDGVFWNNRYTNSLDLNLIQSENIDSIEIVPSPRGFLYGPYNNPVTVNFITRDFIPPVPYARIKYYQGPDGEAMIDGKFSAMIAKRWNYSFQLTNRSKDETYANTDLSLWQFNTKLKYFLSNSVNLQAYYYYVDKEQGLNGGVDYDSLSRSSDDPNADLYDPIFAPVVYPNQKLDIMQHNVGLRTLAKPFDNSQLDLTVYYRYGLDEYRNIRDSLNFGRDYTNKSFGTVINYLQTLSIFTLQVLGDYESTNSELYWVEDNYLNSDTFKRFSFGGVLTAAFFNNYIQTSIYYKQNYWDEVDYWDKQEIRLNGIGADIIFLPEYDQSLYVGYSLRESRSEEENVPAFEIGTRYKNSQLLFDAKYFYNEHFYESHLEIIPPWRFYIQTVKGLGLILNYKFWILLLETNTSYYFEIDEMRTVNLPEWQFVGGL